MKITQLLKDRRVFIISPHFDDAVLSCGSLLLKLAKSTDFTVVNIFTKAHTGPYTLSARRFLQYSGGYRDAQELYANRQAEDAKVLKTLGVKQVNLGLQDVLFRKRRSSAIGRIIPEFDNVYLTYRWHAIKKVSKGDPAIHALAKKLAVVVPEAAFVLAPLGIGNHADHVIARNVCKKLYKNLIFYSDFPYNIREDNYGTAGKGFEAVEMPVNLDQKSELIKIYKSQFAGLFNNSDVPPHKEVYFAKKVIGAK